MASVHQTKTGLTRVQFFNRSGERKTISLGRWPLKAAEKVAERVEAIVASQISGQPLDLDTARWLSDQDEWMYGKLAVSGVLNPRDQQTVPEALGAFIAHYIAGRSDVKEETLKTYRRAERHLLAHFGADCPLRSITSADAEDFRIYLKRQKGRQGGPMAENTIRKTCSISQQFLEKARKRGLIAENPFEEIPTMTGGNEARSFFVSGELARRVLDALPDAQWRLLFALSRYGGLRCPSEHMRLTWQDVNWERQLITIHSSKTEHHEGKATRVIPLFAELRPYLQAAWDEAKEGTTHVITRYRSTSGNLRTQLCRYLNLAGIEQWPKLFHNLRASRETELADQFPMHVVCEWIGNSQLVAKRHYLQVTDEHFDLATAPRAAYALHEGAKQCEIVRGTNSSAHEKPRKMRGDAESCEALREAPVGVTGLEPVTSSV